MIDLVSLTKRGWEWGLYWKKWPMKKNLFDMLKWKYTKKILILFKKINICEFFWSHRYKYFDFFGIKSVILNIRSTNSLKNFLNFYMPFLNRQQNFYEWNMLRLMIQNGFFGRRLPKSYSNIKFGWLKFQKIAYKISKSLSKY